jgi:cobalt-zinc-cadmium efflux system membrane fusion protein
VITALTVAGLVGITALATVMVEHRIHDSERGGDHHGEHGHDEHGDDEHHDDETKSVVLTDEQLAEADIGFAEASKGSVVVSVELPGEIALNGEAMAHVGPRVGGTVRSVEKKLGDEVKKGDVLAVLDSADVAEMQGEVRAAKERYALAKAEYDRKKKLYDEKITSQRAFVAAKQAYAEAKVELQSARTALQARTGGSGAAGGYALVAPLSGTIVGWHLGVGEVLEEDTRAFTIADLSSVWVNVTVYAKDVPKVKVGQRALVHAEGIAEPVEGKISYLSPTVNELTRSATARIVLTEPGEAWRPGLFVTAEVEVDEVQAAVVIPESAVQRLGGQQVVFLREGDRVVARPVVIGRHGHQGGTTLVEVRQGLKPGEAVVATNSFLIKAEIGKATAGHHH